MRKLVLIGLTMMTVFAVAAVAVAQTPGPVLSVTGTVSPKTAGTTSTPMTS